MARLRLIHWNDDEAEERGERLEGLGHEVEWQVPTGAGFLKELRKRPPEAVVIDLSRLPAQGRDMGVMVRGSKVLRLVPLIFVGGLPEKVERVKELLPDAAYTEWKRVGATVERVLAHPPTNPVVPGGGLAGYSGTPLPKKLGIKEGFSVGLEGAPEGFEATLGELPGGVLLSRDDQEACDVLLWFSTSRGDVEKRVKAMGKRAGGGGLWIIWPKKSSGVESDLDQNLVRRLGLEAGLVDYKICAVDETWSGLKFTWRRK